MVIVTAGTVLVDGVRKSTRRKKDPFKKSEYISIHKLENIEDINLGEEQLSQWVRYVPVI